MNPALIAAVERYVARCQRVESGCLVNPGITTGHYGEVRFDGTRMAAHRAVLAVHVGQMPEPATVTRHGCDNPPCCAVEHLSFGTTSENVHDSYRRQRHPRGTWPTGEQRPQAILTAEDVRGMRRMASAGHGLQAIVERFGASYTSTRMAVRGETWQSVTDVPPVAGRKNAKPNPRAYRLTRVTQAQEVRRLSESGYSLAMVADELGITRATAWNLLQVARSVAA